MLGYYGPQSPAVCFRMPGVDGGEIRRGGRGRKAREARAQSQRLILALVGQKHLLTCFRSLRHATEYPFEANMLRRTGTIPTGVCFSPNDSFLYVVKEFNLYQLDLYDSDTSTAWYHVGNMDTTYGQFQMWGNMYLAPNNKVYIGNWNGGSNAFSSIENPNAKGAACQFCPKCLRFPQIGAKGIPCMPNYALGKDTTVNCWPMGVVNVEPPAPVLMVYPNPAATTLTVESEGLKQGLNELQVHNLMGQCMLKETFRSATDRQLVSVHGLPAGVYILKVNNMVRRVVIE